MIIIKLSGKLFTNKENYKKINEGIIKRICEEISQVKEEIIIIHGTGYLGRHLIKQYGLENGLKSSSQLKGFYASSILIHELNNKISGVLNKIGRVSLGFRPYHLIITKNGKIEKINLEIIKRSIDLGITPIMCSDIVLDKEKGFSILSGNKLATYLARLFRAQKLIFVLDVDGVLDNKGNLIKEINSFSEISNLIKKNKKNKIEGGVIETLREIVENSTCTTWIINGLKKGRLRALLRDKEVIGTKIKKN